MKRRLILSVSLILVFTLTLPFCGSRSSALVYNYNESNALFRTSNAKQAARRLLQKKYYISSAENEEQELLWDF